MRILLTLLFNEKSKQVMKNRFSNQIAIITGGARGIGKGIAKRLAKEGAAVYIFDIRMEELKQTITEFKSQKLAIKGRLLDITKEQKIKKAIQKITKKHQRLDIMINCAGITGETGKNIVNYPTANFLKTMEINLTGAFLMTKYSIPPMLKNNYGRIIHLTSVGGKEGNPNMVGYAASKAGLFGLIKGVGKEYAESGITVNGIAPAVIATDLNEKTDPKVLQYMINKIPMKRLGTVEEVANLCCWIASKEASFNTGFVFDLTGGRATY